ncbi:MAG TPA: Gfo/Idh/MocA family oxidoreductase, partial [Casimicrobiaceae bacterium]|nr:Gfo/Idh/MocA family oxidoreductase [Casimicrobiaceae bacterium]
MAKLADTQVGVGVVGAGTIGSVHVRNVAARSDLRLCWVVDVDRSRAAALGEAHGARITTTLDDMLADPAVHVVVIASSTDAHEDNVLAAVRAHKAILCEKPIGNSLDGARR